MNSMKELIAVGDQLHAPRSYSSLASIEAKSTFKRALRLKKRRKVNSKLFESKK